MPERLDPPARNQCLQKNLGWYQLFANLVRGGRYIHDPPSGTVHPITGEALYDGSYLYRLARESYEAFVDRKRRAYNLPYCREILRIYTSTLFRQEVPREPLYEQLEYLKEDVDGKQHGAREFMRRLFDVVQTYGWVAVVTDLPDMDSGNYASAMHERIDGSRPYSQIVPPTRVWDWARDELSGEFSYALIQESSDRWRHWYPDMWITTDEHGEVLATGTHTLGSVPVDIVICEAPGDDEDGMMPFGVSALSDIALMGLEIYQMASLLNDQEIKSIFSFLQIPKDITESRKGDTIKAPEVHLGPDHYIWSGGGTVSWVTPPVSAPQEARDYIEFLVREMRSAAGVSARSEESTEAHSGAALAWEYSSRHNAVYERAQALEDGEGRIWARHGKILGLDITPDVVRYPREFAIQPVDQELTELERIIKIIGGNNASFEFMPQEIKRYLGLKLKRIAIRDVGHLPDIIDVLDDIDQLVEEPAEEPVPPMPPGMVPPPPDGEEPPEEGEQTDEPA